MSYDTDIWHALNDGSLKPRDFGPRIDAVEVRLYADTDDYADAGECNMLVHDFGVNGDITIYRHDAPWSRNVPADIPDPALRASVSGTPTVRLPATYPTIPRLPVPLRPHYPASPRSRQAP